MEHFYLNAFLACLLERGKLVGPKPPDSLAAAASRRLAARAGTPCSEFPGLENSPRDVAEIDVRGTQRRFAEFPAGCLLSVSSLICRSLKILEQPTQQLFAQTTRAIMTFSWMTVLVIQPTNTYLHSVSRLPGYWETQ